MFCNFFVWMCPKRCLVKNYCLLKVTNSLYELLVKIVADKLMKHVHINVHVVLGQFRSK